MRCLMRRVSYEASDNSIPFFTVFCKKGNITNLLQIYYKLQIVATFRHHIPITIGWRYFNYPAISLYNINHPYVNLIFLLYYTILIFTIVIVKLSQLVKMMER